VITRRTLLAAPGALLLAPLVGQRLDLRAFERTRVLRAAARYVREEPITITASSSPRSAGGRHDYFSEGDYWWPDPQSPDGPYIQRDGLSNPDNFVAHRQALIRLSLLVPALAAAWVVTGVGRYANQAAAHLYAWFVAKQTRMNPHLLYAQAIKGRVTGRGVGIIDTLHLVEVVRAVTVMEDGGALDAAVRNGVREWFDKYLTWMTTHEYGQAERDAKNNHATCWVLQVAEFARYTRRRELTDQCRKRFKDVLVPGQIAADGSFPEELRRTKPYGYSLFNLDALAGCAQVLSTGSDNLWTFETADGRGLRKALAFMAPFIADKRTWPQKPDLMYHAEWPMRHSALLFGGLALHKPEYVELWKTLKPDSEVDEVVRNYFIRQPVIWLSARTPA
jgi:hypothetical protein